MEPESNSKNTFSEFRMPEYSESDATPAPVGTDPLEEQNYDLTTVVHPDGRMSQYPPHEKWDDWVEWDGSRWPERVARRYSLVPTVCFNCESACGLLAYVDRETFEVRKFEGNPKHPGSRGRNCAKGPATINQIHDPERILYPLKRVGRRGEGKWERISWDQALDEIAVRMRKSRSRRKDGIMYHVGRPGEDGFTNRCIQAWGVDGHNSHTNICSAGARAGYFFWSGFDRPSPDYAHARVILLISSHLETGHYFNPHAQRIMEAMEDGAKLITMDPRLSNTASKSDVWLPTWPGSETVILLAIANELIQNDQYDREFVRRWVNWRQTLQYLLEYSVQSEILDESQQRNFEALQTDVQRHFNESEGPSENESEGFVLFERMLKILYSGYTFERAAVESGVGEDRIRETAAAVANCEGRLAAHTWRAASIGNRGGWQVARCLFFLNVLTGSVGTRGGTSGNSWNKFVPLPFESPGPVNAWNELHLPDEWPLAFYEMSFLLPHFLEENRGTIDVYFTRVYNPLWINPDGFMWMKMLRDEEKLKCHVAMTPTWNETAWYADYVLPMGHASERHDLMSQETHAGQWIAFRQPVRRVAMERQGTPVRFTYEANPGEVWEENEFWIELSDRMDPDGKLGVREHFQSPYRPGEIITVEEYYRWIFENSVPGLPDAAASEGLTPLEYMRRFGAFEIKRDPYEPFDASINPTNVSLASGGILREGEKQVGVMIDGQAKAGFGTPSGKLEFLSQTLGDWGWEGLEYIIPWSARSHVHPDEIDQEAGEMLLLPNFRLPTLVHTRSANAKWLYELSHRNPIWIHPEDADRLAIETGDLVRVTTRIGYFVDRAWITEGIHPGMIALSHHLGRWRLKEAEGVNRGASNLVTLTEDGKGGHMLRVVHGATAWKSDDPDTSRIWWKDVGVHQNLTHAVQPDPVSGHHCWLQKATNVSRAHPGDQHGDVFVDTHRSMEVYREWKALARPASIHSPDGLRRPWWLKRPLKPVKEAYAIPDGMKNARNGC